MIAALVKLAVLAAAFAAAFGLSALLNAGLTCLMRRAWSQHFPKEKP